MSLTERFMLRAVYEWELLSKSLKRDFERPKAIHADGWHRSRTSRLAGMFRPRRGGGFMDRFMGEAIREAAGCGHLAVLAPKLTELRDAHKAMVDAFCGAVYDGLKEIPIDVRDRQFKAVLDAGDFRSALQLPKAERLERNRPAAEPAPETEPGQSSPAPANKVEQALGVLVAHPEWTVRRIAEAIGCHEKHLSRSVKFKQARAALQGGRDRLPRGTKDADTGKIEAYDN